MADSHEAITYVLKMEGGFVDHPLDPGGATNYGITQKTLDRWHRAYGTFGFPVKHLTAYQARQIYKELYWDKLNLDKCDNQKFATILFDQAVNQGVQRAAERAQRAINYTVRGQRLKLDGKIGPKSLYAMGIAGQTTLLKFYVMSQNYYAALVAARPNLTVFIKGWIVRTHHMLDVILA